MAARKRTGVFARSLLADPLGALTRPVAKPRLPADRPARPYRPKIHQPKPRRVPPRAPSRASRRAPKRTRAFGSPLAHTPLQTLSRPIPQSGSFEAQHLRRAAERYTQNLENEVRRAAATSDRRGGIKSSGLSIGPRTSTELLKELAFYRQTPKAQGRQVTAKVRAKRAEQLAPALWTLEKVGRPGRAVAGGVEAAVRHRDITQAAGRGLTGKEHKTFTDVFKAAGWRPTSGLGKLAQGAAAFGADVLTDPTTYVTGGTSSVAMSAARNVATKAATRAAEAEGAKVFAEQIARGAGRGAAKQAAKNAGKRAHAKTYEDVFNRTMAKSTKSTKRAPEIKVAGRRIGGRHQVRATSIPSRGAAMVSGRIERSKLGPKYTAARLVTRKGAAKLNAQIRPAGLTSDEFRLGRQIKRERRAQKAAGAYRARQRAHTIARVVQPEERRAFGTAIEAGEHGQLSNAAPIKLKTSRRTRRTVGEAVQTLSGPKRLKVTADRYRRDIDEMRDALETAGVPIGKLGGHEPASVPGVTADVKGAQSALGKAKRTRARAEREHLEQLKPGMKPGPLTKAQKARAGREHRRALSAKRGHLDEFERLHRQIGKASPAVAKRLRARAGLVRSRIRAADDAVQHWTAVLSKREIPTRRVVTHELPVRASREQPRLTVTSREAPKRGTIKAAKAQEKQAKKTLRSTAKEAREQRSAQRRVERLNAERATHAKGYDPRVLAKLVEQHGPVTLEDVIDQSVARAGTGRKPPQAFKRRQKQPLETLRQGSPEDRAYAAQFTEHPELKYQAYLTAGERALAQAESEGKLFATGRPVQRGQKIELGEGERIYHREPGVAKLRELDTGSAGAAERAEIEKGRGEKGDYAVLNKAFHDFVQEPDSEISNAWARLMGGWKGWALKTPSYLMRNATGDLFNAMGAQRPDRLAFNWVKGQRALKAREKAATGYEWFQDAASSATGRKTVTLNGREFTYDQLAMLAEATGAIDAGRLAEAAEQANKSLRPKGTKAWDRVSDRVENSARMGTFIGALERGMTPEHAADLVRDIHFDYGELTKIEKGIRSNVLPFYTFSARNIPLQAKLLYQRPGLAASVQSAREEGRKQAGLPEDFWKGLDPYEAKQLGVPLKFGDKTYTVSTGAPITDLNVLTPANPKDPASWLGQVVAGPGKRGLELFGPYKIVGELLTNHSLFYGEPIKPDPRSGQANMTPVNPVVGQMAETLGEPFRKRFGIEKQLDKKTGKEVWSWGREKEYALTSALPGPFGAAYRATRTATGPRGFSPATEALGTLAGVRAKELEPNKAEATRLNNELNEKLLPRINILNSAGHNLTYRPTPELLKLEARRKKIETRLDVIGRATKAFYKGRPNIPQAPSRPGGRSLSGGRSVSAGRSLRGGGRRLSAGRSLR
jgi:hypothetical protein